MRLGTIPIICIGLCFAMVILSYGYFYHYQPDTEEARDQEAQAVALYNNARQLPKAAERRQNAIDQVNKVVAQWQDIVATRTPTSSLSTGGINMAVNAWQMTIDARVYRNSIQKAVNRQLKVGGVKVINGPTIPMPSEDAANVVADFFNYPAIPFPIVIFDLGQITVQGTYSQIKTNMEAWTNMPNYLAVADGLALAGTSPILTGTYSVTIVGYIRGNTVYPSVQEAAGGAAAPGGAGGRPGGPGGKFGGGAFGGAAARGFGGPGA